MSEVDWMDFGEGQVEQDLSWRMTGNWGMTSAVAQCKACSMKWRNQTASITSFNTPSTPLVSKSDLKKDIFIQPQKKLE